MPYPAISGKELTLVASAARTATGNSGSLDLASLGALIEGTDLPAQVASYILRVQLDVTAASGTTPTLDVVVQDSLDGTNWNTVGTFSQKTAASREVINIGPRGDAQPAGFAWPFHPRKVRIQWTIGGTTPSFTFSVLASLL